MYDIMETVKKTDIPTGLEVAVIGMAGRFPGAKHIDEFWDNIKNGIGSISFSSEEELSQWREYPGWSEDSNFVNSKGGLLEEKEFFDASFFGYTPKEATIMHPQLRIFHECAWEALENSGYNAESYDGLIGLFAGSASSFFWESRCFLSGQSADLGHMSARFLSDKDHLGTKVAHKLGLKGASFIISNACSTALVAIHLACRALLAGDCDMVLAGGVSIRVENDPGYFYQEGMIMSPDGLCRAFDAKAKGLIPGDGIGLVVLKLLEDALEDKDHVYAVIKGSAINNDGNRKVGYEAPSVDGQAEVIRTAYRLAGVKPGTITYIEAHGTGTELGDPIEMSALKLAFNTVKKGVCGIGSVKTNIGHLDNAAGAAGFIKTVLALTHKIIPPTLYFEIPNPEIDFIDSPFYINTRAAEWKDDHFLLRAGVSSFGMGGTNCHIVLEEAPETGTKRRSYQDRQRGQHTYQLIPLSAKTQTALDKATENFIRHLKENPTIDLADAAYTLQVGRKAFAHRRITVSSDIHEAIENLSAPDSNNVYTSYSIEEKVNVVFMFSGEGAHYRPMLMELYRIESVFREQVDRCFEMLNGRLDYDIKEFHLRRTEIPPPVLFIFEYSLVKLLMTWRVKPHSMIGHGIGVYTAACLSGVISLEDALELLVLRGNGIQEVQQESVIKKFAEKLNQVKGNRPQIPYISALSGHWITAEEASDQGYWLKHLQGIDRSAEGLTELLKNENSIFIEIGPAGILSKTLRQHTDLKANHTLINLVRQCGENAGESYYFLTQIGRLWVSGVKIDWCKINWTEKRYRLPLPTYPFERQSYWIEGNLFQVGAEMLADKSKTAKKADIADWFYLPSWKRSVLSLTEPYEGKERKENSTGSFWLVFEDACGLGSQLVQRLKRDGQEVIIVKAGSAFSVISDRLYNVNPGKNTDYDELFNELRSIGKIPGNIVHLWSVTGGSSDLDLNSVERVLDFGFYSLLYLAQTIGKRNFDNPFRITIIADNMHNVTGEEELCPAKAALVGAVKVIPQEYANIDCSCIDIVLSEKGNGNNQRLVDQLMLELSQEKPDKIAAFRGNYYWLPTFEPIRLEKKEERQIRLKEKGVYLITGGLGGIGFELANHLARKVHARLVLTGRSAFPAKEEWDRWLDTHDVEDKISLKIRKIQELEDIGAEVLVCSANVANLEEMQAVVTQAGQRFGRINGIIHAAGIPDGCVIHLRTREMTDEILSPKVIGTLVLDRLLKDVKLDFFVMCSSLSSIIPLFGQVGYSAANAFQDAFAYQKMSHPGQFYTAINWDAWKEVGMGLDTVKQLSEAQNIKDAQILLQNGILNAEGVEVFNRILGYALPQVVVSTSDLAVKIEQQSRAVLTGATREFEVETFKGKLYPRPELGTEYVAPRTEFEKTFANILKNFFGYDQVGINDNFFEFGVTSLTIIRINNLLRDELQKIIPIVVMFEYPTIASLGEYLQREEKGEPYMDNKFEEVEDLEKEEELLHDFIGLLREDS